MLILRGKTNFPHKSQTDVLRIKLKLPSVTIVEGHKRALWLHRQELRGLHFSVFLLTLAFTATLSVWYMWYTYSCVYAQVCVQVSGHVCMGVWKPHVNASFSQLLSTLYIDKAPVAGPRAPQAVCLALVSPGLWRSGITGGPHTHPASCESGFWSWCFVQAEKAPGHLLFWFILFETGYLRNSSCPGTHSEDQDDLELTEVCLPLPASAPGSSVLFSHRLSTRHFRWVEKQWNNSLKKKVSLLFCFRSAVLFWGYFR